MVKADKLSGKKIIGSNGNILGEVSGVEVDLSTWRINCLYVDISEEASRELGIKSSFWSANTVCMPITAINQVGDVITLNTNSLRGIIVNPKQATITTPIATV